MRTSIALSALFLALASGGAVAHHGWGSYDASNRLTIEAAVESVAWQNPHVHLSMQHENALWHITLAPVSRMRVRGLSEDMLQPGTVVAAEGHPSTRNPNEMRAERIIVDGKTFEMR